VGPRGGLYVVGQRKIWLVFDFRQCRWLNFSVVSVRPIGPTLNFSMRDFKLPPRLNGNILSYGMLRSVDWQFVPDV
jgi:hypothetical protein